jgi:hypothetical protein
MSLDLRRRAGIYFRKPGWLQDYNAAAKWSPVGGLADGRGMTIASFAGYLPMFRPMPGQYRVMHRAASMAGSKRVSAFLERGGSVEGNVVEL